MLAATVRETEVADEICSLIQSQLSPTGPTSPIADLHHGKVSTREPILKSRGGGSQVLSLVLESRTDGLWRKPLSVAALLAAVKRTSRSRSSSAVLHSVHKSCWC